MTRNIWMTGALLTVSGLMLPLAAQAQGRAIWSGNVDDTAVVSVHGSDVQTRTVSGKAVTNVNTQVSGRLPHRPVFVSLRRRGRGQVQVVEQPRPFNGYTAKVRIHDPQPGSHRYRFALVW